MWNEIDQRIRRAVHHLEKKVMSTFKQLADILTGIGSDVTTVQGGVSTLNTNIADLKNQLAAAGTTLSADAQASLDAAVTQAGTIKSSMDAIAAGFQSAANVATVAAAGVVAAPADAPAAPSA